MFDCRMLCNVVGSDFWLKDSLKLIFDVILVSFLKKLYGNFVIFVEIFLVCVFKNWFFGVGDDFMVL